MKDLKIIDWRFVLTPFASAEYIVKGIGRRRYYVFGFKIVDLVV